MLVGTHRFPGEPADLLAGLPEPAVEGRGTVHRAVVRQAVQP
jgi:hypothetical protein